MTATGRGAASAPNTVSPDNASPAPAGHKCGRSTNACKPSVIERNRQDGADRTRSDEWPHARADCSACDILHKRHEIRRVRLRSLAVRRFGATG